MSYTSWFLDELNYALNIAIDVLNLRICDPYFERKPFTEKIDENAAHDVIPVRGIGNYGPF